MEESSRMVDININGGVFQVSGYEHKWRSVLGGYEQDGGY